MTKKFRFCGAHRIYQALIYGAIALFAYGLVRYSRQTSAVACEALRLCGNVLIPALFPFFVVSSMAVSTGLARQIGHAMEKPMRVLFGVPGVCAPAFVLGLVGGYPVGAKTAIGLYRQKLCTKTEAERLLAFCNNSGPAFILGVAGAAVFSSSTAGLLLYGAHILSGILVGVVFRFYGKSSSSVSGSLGRGGELPFSKAFPESVRDAASSIINICAFVIFFTVATRLLNQMGILPALSGLLGRLLQPFGFSPEYAERLLGGILELTTGIWGLTDLGGPLGARLAIAAFMLGWASLSVHCQVLAFLHDSDLSVWPYLGGKMLHGLFAAALTWLGAYLLPFDLAAFSHLGKRIHFISTLKFSQSFWLALLLVCLVWCLLWLASLAGAARKKHCGKARRTL